MSRPEPKSANYAAVAQRDKLASALAAETGCGFVEAWTRVLDGEMPTGKDYRTVRTQFEPKPETADGWHLGFRIPAAMEPETCLCGADDSPNGLRLDILCPKHDAGMVVA